MCHPITTSVDHNSITNATSILTTSSSHRKIHNKNNFACAQIQEYELEIDYDQLMLEKIITMDSYEQHLCAYLALCIEQQLIQNIKRNLYKCSECAVGCPENNITWNQNTYYENIDQFKHICGRNIVFRLVIVFYDANRLFSKILRIGPWNIADFPWNKAQNSIFYVKFMT